MEETKMKKRWKEIVLIFVGLIQGTLVAAERLDVASAELALRFMKREFDSTFFTNSVADGEWMQNLMVENPAEYREKKEAAAVLREKYGERIGRRYAAEIRILLERLEIGRASV